MTIQLAGEYGKVLIANEVVSALAGSAALECYGLVGMASRKQLKDGIAELLGKDNLGRGVVIRQENDLVHIDLHIIVGYGVKISEVAHNVQNKVKYALQDMVGFQIGTVNIFVQDVRVSK